MFTVNSTSVYIRIFFLWLQIYYIVSEDDRPINFPRTIPISTGDFCNWANDLFVPNVWIAIPASEKDVVTLANWANQNNYKLRASGYMHNWSPLTVTKNSTENVVLVNTIVNLNRIEPPEKVSPSKYTVSVQTGASMLQLLTFLEDYGLGLYATPAVGDLTVGGVLAVGAHGTGVPYRGEALAHHSQAYGTISNLVISFKAVVWDVNAFVIKTFQRNDFDAKAFLVNFGRTFVTEVTLMVGSNYYLRCQSILNITTDQLFSRSTGQHTFSHLLDQYGRVEATIFPFTKRPWLKVWTVAPDKPLSSRHVTRPFNYPITETIPENTVEIIRRIVEGENSFLASKFGEMALALIETSLVDTMSYDIWGRSKNLLLYVTSTTLRLAENGYAVITERANVQKVLNSFNDNYRKLIDSYKKRGKYPINGPVAIRATSLDHPDDVISNSESPSFSPIHPVHGHPEYDTVIWINVLSIPDSPGLYEAMNKLETFMWNEYNGTYASVRPEWSKGWAYTNRSAWDNEKVYRFLIPSSFDDGNSISPWNWAVNTLDKYDPKRIFTNIFLDVFLKTV